MIKHLNISKEKVAKVVLMPGDPLRAKYIANKYLTKVELINEVRGMLSYTGFYNNKKISIIPSGMGIPSMGIYSYELFEYYGVQKIIRVGTCGAKNNLQLGEVVICKTIHSISSYSKEFMDEEITNIECNLPSNINIKPVHCLCVEAFHSVCKKAIPNNVDVIEMESFALQLNAQILQKEAYTLLTVSDLINDLSKRLTNTEKEKKLDQMIDLALEML